jgi:hypothetical protein
MGGVSDLFEEAIIEVDNVDLPPPKSFDSKLNAPPKDPPTKDAAYTLIKKVPVTSLEKMLFNLTYNTLSYLIAKYEDDEDLKRDITQTRSDAMEFVLKDKFGVGSIHAARNNNLSLKLNETNEVELLKRRADD